MLEENVKWSENIEKDASIETRRRSREEKCNEDVGHRSERGKG